MTAFHSYHSGCEARDTALVNFLQPVAHRFDDCCSGRIVDSYIAAIDLLTGSGVRVDLVLLEAVVLIARRPSRRRGNVPSARRGGGGDGREARARALSLPPTCQWIATIWSPAAIFAA